MKKAQVFWAFAALLTLCGASALAEAPYDFRKRLECVHEAGRRDFSIAAKANEFAFSNGTTIAIDEDSHVVVKTAAADFCDYLKVSMSVEASISHDHDKSTLSLKLDSTLPLRTYRIAVGRNVKIAAADSRAAAQALYHLEDMMNLRSAPFLEKAETSRTSMFSPRMTHSGWGLDVFPDAYLSRIAHAGMDAIVIFITGVDRTRGVPRQDVGSVIRRAKKYGLDTYLYCKFPPSEHPDTMEAKAAFDATYGKIAAAYPEAKGLVFVGESCQFPTKDERAHLVPWKKNPKDMRRTSGWWPCFDWINWLDAVRSSIDAKNKNLEIVFWTYNWGRHPAGPRLELIDRLPTDVSLMATFEMFEPQVKRNGLRAPSEDYSLSFEGPGRYFASEAKQAKKRGLRMYAMSNTGALTWDYGTVPYQPCPYQWKRRYDNIVKAKREWNLAGLMECHHYGWFPSFVSELEKEAFTEGGIPFQEHIRMIAARDYGAENVERVLEAWELWSQSARDFVASNINQYGPFRIGPSYPYNFGGRHIANTEFPISKNATNKNIARYNYLDKSSYSPNSGEVKKLDLAAMEKEFELLEAMREALGKGADVFEDIAKQKRGRQGETARRMALLGRYMQRTVITAINVKHGAIAHRAGDKLKVLEWARKEYANAKAALPLVEADSRLGWEPTMEYVGGAEQIRWKLKRMEETYSAAIVGERISGVADDICTIDKVTFRDSANKECDGQLEIWRAEAKEDVVITGVFVNVDFTLRPESGSCIKCRAILPMPHCWDTRLWGLGGSGRAGVVPNLDQFVAMNTAAVTTDLGTRAAGEKYTDRSHAWPECVLRDFHWRATHLMTVYGKRIVQAFYGRPCSKAYFYGGSTGGRQGIIEALRFPGDYDGIVSFLPAVMGAVNEVAIWHLWRQTHDDEGRALFTKEDFAAIAAAAIEFRSKSDPKPYAGSVIADGRFTEAEIDGFIKIAVKNRPALAAGDRPARLKALYMPLVHDGKCYFTGFTPGTDHGANFHWGSLISMPHFLAGKGFVQSVWKKVGFKEVDMYLAELSPQFNACSLELDAFVKRGGKIIMTTGWEDQTVPPGPIVEYYERLCRKYGGVGKVSEFMRLFCIPGCAHGGSKGRIITGGVPSGRVMKQQLVDWCEKGIPPEKLVLNWRARKMQLPIAPYPQLYVQDDAKGWKLQEARRSVPCIDASCIKTDLKNLKERND